MSWELYVELAGIFIGAFMVVVLPFLAVGPRGARMPLAGLFLLLVLYGIGSYLSVTRTFEVIPHLMRVGSTLQFGLGPLLYLYGRGLAFPKRAWRKRDLLHGLPVVLEMVLRLRFFLLPGEAKIALARSGVIDSWDLYQSRLGALVLAVSYLVALLRLTRHHESVLLQHHSRLTGRHLTWLLWIAAAWGSVPLFDCLSLLGSSNEPPILLMMLTGHTGAWVGLLTILMAILGLVMPSTSLGLREDFRVPGEDPSPDPEPREDASHASRLLARVQAHMETERSYLQPDLSLSDLAGRLRMSPTALSKAINTGLGLNFFTFVNGYRVQEAQRRLRDGASSRTVLEIAQDSGFASKSTFNEVFKRLCGLTPTEFRRREAQTSESGRPES